MKKGLSFNGKEKLLTYREGSFDCTVLGNEAILKFRPWMPEQKKPSLDEALALAHDREYVKVKVRSKEGYIAQPRKTICYGHSYAYSGQVHPIERETPEYIEQLLNETEKISGEPVNMCLINVYCHGNHSISAHSDDERQMGASKSVHCWVIGSEPRKAIFTRKSDNKRFHFMIPEGLYVMYGENFQRDFKHEFPKMYQTAYKKEFLKHGENADDIWERRQEIREKIRGTAYFDDFEKWCQPRVSYTLRYFTESNKKIKK